MEEEQNQSPLDRDRDSGHYKKLSTGNVRVPQHVAKSMAKARSKKSRGGKPKPLYFWSNTDVVKWMKKNYEELHQLYGANFTEHDITGRSLVRLNDYKLEKMGIPDAGHRDDLLRVILKLKLKNELIELKNLEQKAKS